MILLDTSGLFEALSPDQPRHDEVLAVLAAEAPPLVLSPFVLAELDYLLLTRGPVDSELRFLREVARGAYDLASFSSAEVAAASEIVARYRDLRVGLTDALIVVLAERYRTNRMLTLDERHFRVLRTPRGEPFTILPADA